MWWKLLNCPNWVPYKVYMKLLWTILLENPEIHSFYLNVFSWYPFCNIPCSCHMSISLLEWFFTCAYSSIICFPKMNYIVSTYNQVHMLYKYLYMKDDFQQVFRLPEDATMENKCLQTHSDSNRNKIHWNSKQQANIKKLKHPYKIRDCN